MDKYVTVLLVAQEELGVNSKTEPSVIAQWEWWEMTEEEGMSSIPAFL